MLYNSLYESHLENGILAWLEGGRVHPINWNVANKPKLTLNILKLPNIPICVFDFYAQFCIRSPSP